MWPRVRRKVLQIADQIKGFTTRGAQLQRISTQLHDKVGLPACLREETFQDRHPCTIAIADPNLARDRRATLKRLGPMFIGQFKM